MVESSKISSLQLMPDVLDIREITYTNLLILEFDPESNEAKHRIPFNRDMFAFPNKKGMEVVLYFLFSTLNADAAVEEFRHCWPIYDKKQEHAFRKVVIGWLSRLSKEDPECHVPKTFASLLLNPGGDKFYRLLFHFSTYVLQTKLKETAGKKLRLPPYPQKSGATKTVFSRLSRIYTNRMLRDTQSMLEYSKCAAIVQESWLGFASTLIREHRSLCKTHRDWEKKKVDLDARCQEKGLASGQSLSTQSPYTKDVSAIKRTKLMQKVRQQLKEITQLYAKIGKSMNTIDQVLKGSLKSQVIKGSDLSVKVPERLLREFEDEIHQRKIQNIYSGEKLNLISLVELWNLSLVMIKEKLEEVNLPDFAEDEAQMRERLHHHTACLEVAKSLRKSLADEMLPDIRESIDELLEVVDLKEKKETKKAFEVTRLGFELMPATPDRFLMDTSSNASATEAEKTSVFGNTDVRTPDAVTSLLQCVRDRSKAEEESRDNHKLAPTSAVKRVPSASKKTKSFIPTLKDEFLSSESSTSTVKKKGRNDRSHVSKVTKHDERKTQRTLFEQEKAPKKRQKMSEDKIKDFLADKIVADVMSKRPTTVRCESSESESSQSDSNQEEAVKNPVAALGKEGFKTKHEILRTPIHPRYGEQSVGNDLEDTRSDSDIGQPRDTPIYSTRQEDESLTTSKKEELSSLIARYKQLKLKAVTSHVHEETADLQRRGSDSATDMQQTRIENITTVDSDVLQMRDAFEGEGSEYRLVEKDKGLDGVNIEIDKRQLSPEPQGFDTSPRHQEYSMNVGDECNGNESLTNHVFSLDMTPLPSSAGLKSSKLVSIHQDNGFLTDEVMTNTPLNNDKYFRLDFSPFEKTPVPRQTRKVDLRSMLLDTRISAFQEHQRRTSPILFSEEIDDDFELLTATEKPQFDSPVFSSGSVSPVN